MQFPKSPLLVLLGLLATNSFAAPQTSLNDLPACAQQAALAAISATGCSLTDVRCICDSVPFLQTLRTYIESNCSPADQAAALQFGQNICLTVGVTISATVPSATGMPASTSLTTTLTSGTATSTTLLSSSSSAMAGNMSCTAVTSVFTTTETSIMCSSPVATFTGGAVSGAVRMGLVGIMSGVVGTLISF